MQFKQFAEFLDKIENTAGRNDMMKSLAEFIPQLDSAEIAPAMYLLQGRLVPNYVDLEFGFSQKSALKALETLTKGDVNKWFGELGDVGLVAEKVIANQKSEIRNAKHKDIATVYAELDALARLTGKGSQEAKQAAFTNLISSLDPLSARYVSRVVIGNLRLGLSDKTVLDALSFAKTGDKSLRAALDVAYGSRADIGDLAKIVMNSDSADLAEKLTHIKFVPGTPVASKLVERESSAAAVFERMGKSLVQPKLDGLRAQIHLLPKDTKGPRVEIYSRNMERLTDSFPDIVEAAQNLPADSLIIDSEAIGYDTENESYLPFQQTIQRRRKYDIDETAGNIPVRAMAFDLLYLNGEDISRKDVEFRVNALSEVLGKSNQSTIKQLETKVIDTEPELEKYFKDKIGMGLEGIIVKKLGTTYDPGTRNFDWIKLKANTQSDLVDTIDTVVLGYFYGRGVRAKFGVGALLVGVYNQDDGLFYSVAKVGTGMSDEQFGIIKKDLEPLELKEKPAEVVVDKILYPDVWVRPEIVMEVTADEITRSPGHTAAREMPAKFETGKPEKGLSLRFPRMNVWKRDKNADQATTVKELLRLYELRKSKLVQEVTS
jgi:DNA ligase-1